MNQIKKIQIVNSETVFDKLINKFDFEKCAYTGNKCDKSKQRIRLVFHSDDDMFDAITEAAVLSESDFIAFGGRNKKQYYVAVEIAV